MEKIESPTRPDEYRLHFLLSELKLLSSHNYLSLLKDLSQPYEEMHRLLDDIFLLNLSQSIEIQHIPKDDEEE